MATFNSGGFGTISPLVERPTAVVVGTPSVAVLGGTVRLDGSGSINPTASDLTYSWAIVASPIGSKTPYEPFRQITEDWASVWFSPDLVGEYIIELTVTSGNFESKAQARVSVRAILVPDGRAIVPDGKFIWSYLRDVWQQVEDRQIFETLWSALIQICGAELLKLYQFDFNKSIRDIQEKMQRRWLAYEPRLELDPAGMTVFLGNEEAGQGGSTQLLGREAKAVIFSSNELIVVEGSVLADVPPFLDILYSRSSSNVGEYRTMGTNAGATGYRINGSIPSAVADRVPTTSSVFSPQFPFQSRTWALQAPPDSQYALKMSIYPPTVDQLSDIYSIAGAIGDVRVGDVAYIATGVNVGFYRITASTGIFIEVDRAPPSSSQPTDQVIIFRPVGIKFAPLPSALSASFTVPQLVGSSAIASLAKGRLVTIGGRAYPVLRSMLDIRQPVPTFIVTTDDAEVVTGRSNLNWRVPHTLVSPSVDFEAEGVTSGDLLLFDVRLGGRGGVAQFSAQVIGVHGRRLAFVLTTEVLAAGEGYTVPDSVIADTLNAMGVGTVKVSPVGAVSFTGDAANLYSFVKSGLFAQQFWNTEIDLSTGFVTPVGRVFVSPRAVIRNSKIPVDDTVLSIPVLQEWVAQPTLVEKNGKVYQKKGNAEFELPRRPVMLVEGNDYLTDGTTAFDDTVPFRTGTSTLEVEGAGFLSRQVAPGDRVSIPTAISLNLPYIVVEVVSEDKLLLSTPIPELLVPVTTERVVVTRRSGGKYLRLLPGGFTAAKPAPDRFWAEVSYFDNSDAIESNFGIMVGLRKEDLDKITTRVSYRQAVAGLMFAYTRGSTIEKVRLGAQILLGLPFAEHRGVVRSMESNYRTDASGVSVLGRLLIEDVDDAGVPSGIQRVYTYPIDHQSSDLSGVEVNPATGVTYAVDDVVEAFAPLAKGVGVSDYLTDPLKGQASGISQLQKFHSFRLRANDNLFNIEEITLVSSFLRRITPSYVAFVLLEVTQLGDDVSISDSIGMVLRRGGIAGLVDDVGTGLGTPFMFDQRDFSGHSLVRWDDGVFKLRRSGKDAIVVDVDQVTGTVNFSGDIVSTVMPGELIKVGDYVIFSGGPNAGTYPITVVTEGVGVTIDTTGKALTPGIDQPFIVARKVSEVIRSGFCWRLRNVDASGVMGTTRYGAITADPHGFVIDAGDVITDISSSPTRTASFSETGNILDGVMPGDWLFTCGGRLLITDVQNMVVTVIGETGFSPEGNVPYTIIRPSLLPSPSESSWSIISDGSSYSCNDDLRLMADPGDYLEIVSPAGFAEIFVADAGWNNYLPVLPANTYTVRLKKKNRPQGPLGFDFILNGNINDQVDIYLRSPNLIDSDATGTITIPAHEALSMGAQIGDFIRLYDITQIDNGYGLGVYPIASITASGGDDVVVLSGGMVDGGTTAWSLLRRR
jgi:hypothetical protein